MSVSFVRRCAVPRERILGTYIYLKLAIEPIGKALTP